MEINKFIIQHKKILFCLLVFFILSRVVVATHYISKRDSSGHWRLECHQALTGNPHYVWEGNTYYYGLNSPKEIYVKATVDGWVDETKSTVIEITK
jgi:hypothetical protein